MQPSGDRLHVIVVPWQCQLERLRSLAHTYLIHPLVKVLIDLWDVHFTYDLGPEVANEPRMVVHGGSLEEPDEGVGELVVALVDCDMQRRHIHGVLEEGHYDIVFLGHGRDEVKRLIAKLVHG